LIEIVFVACLLAQPERCEERVLPAFTDVTEIQCMMGGQFALAAWSRTNGHLRVAEWRCQPVRLAERDA
jgi:hypothetical protein